MKDNYGKAPRKASGSKGHPKAKAKGSKGSYTRKDPAKQY
jgi:hypothetical protein